MTGEEGWERQSDQTNSLLGRKLFDSCSLLQALNDD